MAGFIPDASAALPWCFEDEATPWTESLLNRLAVGERIVVPAHWPLEVTNGLLMAIRRGRVTGEKVRRFIEDLKGLALRIEPPLSPMFWPGVLETAEQHRLTAYDAAYLELARRTGLPLATLDGDLQTAAATAECRCCNSSGLLPGSPPSGM
jgi:predicted nucleic acid-binding protein